MDNSIELIKRTCAPEGTTNDELALFLYTARKYDLDPLLSEIWMLRLEGRATIKVSRDGFLKIAHKSGVFDGMETETVRDERGNVIKAVCKVYRKDMSRPFVYEAHMAEFNNPNSRSWKKYPISMLIKVAEANALKRAFQVSGVIAADDTAEEERQSNHQVGQDYRDELRAAFATLPAHRRDKAMALLSGTVDAEKYRTYMNMLGKVRITQQQADMIKKSLTDAQIAKLLQKYDVTKVEHLTKDVFDEAILAKKEEQ
ncbi:MAG: RecT family recombinase [Candidatus Thermochlorobacter sp.]